MLYKLIDIRNDIKVKDENSWWNFFLQYKYPKEIPPEHSCDAWIHSHSHWAYMGKGATCIFEYDFECSHVPLLRIAQNISLVNPSSDGSSEKELGASAIELASSYC